MNNWIYILLLIAIIILLLFDKRYTHNNFRKSVAIILMLFSGFRYCVGTDYLGYCSMFDLIATRGRYYNIEYGYYHLVKFVQLIGGTQQLVFLIMACATIMFIYQYIEEFSADKELSWLLYLCIGPYFLSSFNGVRQVLPVAMFAFSLKYMKDGKFIKYLITNLIGFLFHYSAIIAIPLYFLFKKVKLTAVKTICIYLGLLLLYKVGLVNYLLTLFHASSYILGSDSFIMDKSYVIFAVMAVFCWAYYFFVTKDQQKNLQVFLNMNLLSFLMVLLGLTTTNISNMVFARLNVYFFIAYLILVPNTLVCIKNVKYRHVTNMFVILLCFSYYFYTTITATDLTPYLLNLKLFG
jgi:hypothetical protein